MSISFTNTVGTAREREIMKKIDCSPATVADGRFVCFKTIQVAVIFFFWEFQSLLMALGMVFNNLE